MGNRAVVIEKGRREGIYQHWNGGRDSIEPMLYYANNFLTQLPSELYENNIKKLAFVSMCCGFNPEYSSDYDTLCSAEGDNGTYVIDKDFSIVERREFDYPEQRYYKFEEVLLFIDDNMPKNMKKGKDFILRYLASEEVEKTTVMYNSYQDGNKQIDKILFNDAIENLTVGDIVYYRDQFFTIIGKNEEEKSVINGRDVGNAPFFNYTENYDESNPFYADTTDESEFKRLKSNPNSYFGYYYCEDLETGERIKVLDYDSFRIVNKSKLDEYLEIAESFTK